MTRRVGQYPWSREIPRIQKTGKPAEAYAGEELLGDGRADADGTGKAQGQADWSGYIQFCLLYVL